MTAQVSQSSRSKRNHGRKQFSSPCDRQLRLVDVQAGRVEGGQWHAEAIGALHTTLDEPPTAVITCWDTNSAANPATHQANAAVNPVGILQRLQPVNNDATNRSEGRCDSRYIPLPRTGRLTHR